MSISTKINNFLKLSGASQPPQIDQGEETPYGRRCPLKPSYMESHREIHPEDRDVTGMFVLDENDKFFRDSRGQLWDEIPAKPVGTVFRLPQSTVAKPTWFIVFAPDKAKIIPVDNFIKELEELYDEIYLTGPAEGWDMEGFKEWRKEKIAELEWLKRRIGVELINGRKLYG